MNWKHLILLLLIASLLIIFSIILLIHKLAIFKPQQVALLEEFREDINRAVFSRDGKLLARGFDTMITITDTTNGKTILAVPTEEGNKDNLVFSNSSIYLAYAKREKIFIWNVNTGKAAASLTGTPHIVSISISDTFLAAGDFNGTITIWEIKTWKKITQFQLSKNVMKLLTFSQDGKFLAIGYSSPVIKILKSGTWEEHSTLHGDFTPTYSGLSPSAASLFISNDNKYLVAGDCEGRTTIWDTEKWKSSVIEKDPERLGCFRPSYSFSHKGNTLAIGENNRFRILEVGSWRNIAVIEPIINDRLGICPAEVAFSAENDNLLIYSCSALMAYNESGLQQFSKTSLAITGESLSFIHGRDRLAVGHIDGFITIWELNSNQKEDMWTWKEVISFVAHEKEVTSLAADNDGKYLASSCGCEVKVWDTVKWANLATLNNSKGLIRSLIFTDDGKLLGAAETTGQIKLWETSTWKEAKTIQHSANVDINLALSNDLKYIASVSTYGNPHIWDTGDWKETAALKPRGFLDLFSFKTCGSHGESVALSQKETVAVGYSDGCIKIWKIKGSKRMASFQSKSDSIIKALAFSQDSQYIAFSGGNLEIWKLSQ